MDDVLVHAPIEIADGQTYENKRLLVQDDYQSDSYYGVIKIVGKEDWIVRDIEIVGKATWQARWQDRTTDTWNGGPPGICSRQGGIVIYTAHNGTLHNISIHGFPGTGIYAQGLSDASWSDLTFTRCEQAVKLEHQLNGGVHTNCKFRRMHARDLWMAGDAGRVGWDGDNDPSVVNATGNPDMGVTAFAFHNLNDSVVYDCSALGETYAGFKAIHPMRTRFLRLRTNAFVLQGRADTTGTIDPDDSTGSSLESSVIDKNLGAGAVTRLGNALHCNYSVADFLVQDCHLNGYGQDGHGVELVKSTGSTPVHATVTGCTIGHFNQMRGVDNARAFSVYTSEGCSLNADALTANYLYSQTLDLLEQ